MILNAKFIPPPIVSIKVKAPVVGISTGSPVAREYVDRDPYEGEYVITPGLEEQTLLTKNLWMVENVTIGAIPSDYGKITWNGTVLTVS